MLISNRLLLLGAVALLACGTSSGPGQVYIRGTVTSVERGTDSSGQGTAFPRFLVEEDPTRTILETNTKKSLVSWNSSTVLTDAIGTPVNPNGLKPGLIVSVWITGVVLDSYPDQVSAVKIRIEKQ